MELCLRQQELESALSHVDEPSKELVAAHAEALEDEEHAAAEEATYLGDLARTAAPTLEGIAAKLAVVVREAEDNTDLDEFPVAHVRSALADLRHMIQRIGPGSGTQSLAGLAGEDFAPASLSLAASCAFQAWSLADGKRYRIWAATYKSLAAL